MKIALVGEGAIGVSHLKAINTLPDVEVVLLIGGVEQDTQLVAREFGIPKWTTDFTGCVGDPGFDAVILATPTPLHTEQGVACLQAGKHVLVEIPIADTLAGAERLTEAQKVSGLVAMAGHLRRFNTGHAWIHKRIAEGELTLRQFVVQTHFLRRTNINLLGKPRSWTDSLLWHHACHSVDLFLYQAGESVSIANAIKGPLSPSLKIPLDFAIQLKTPMGKLASISLSFNNEGPQGSLFRYICDEGTYIARDDALMDGAGNAVNAAAGSSLSGMARINQAFFDAIRNGTEPNASFAQCLPAMRLIDRLERSLA